MREPRFWQEPSSLLARLLSPVGFVYGTISGARMKRRGDRAGVPVICVGNYHTGGAGKTPTVLAVCVVLEAMGERPVVVSRGYGGSATGPLRVDADKHSASEVGDEPMMMAKSYPVVVSKDRIAGAALAHREGATVIVLDDGFQSASLKIDLALIVIDAARGVGNGFVFPAGPLRAPLDVQIARTDALVVIGEGEAASPVVSRVQAAGGEVMKAALTPNADALKHLRGRRVLAFAGIGDPQRFVRTLTNYGIDVVAHRAFADHHTYTPDELSVLTRAAAAQNLRLVTTEKDMARIRSDPALASYVDKIAVLPVTLEFESDDALRRLIRERVARARSLEI